MNSAFTCNFLTTDQKTLIPQCFLIYRKLCLQLLPKLNYNFIKWYKIKLTFALGDGCGHSNICTPIKKQLINKNVKNTFYWQKILRSDILINKQFYGLNGWGLVTFNAYVILSDFFSTSCCSTLVALNYICILYWLWKKKFICCKLH